MKHIGLLSTLGVAGAVLTMSTASLAAPPPPAPAPQPYTTAPPSTVVVQPPRPGVTAPQPYSAAPPITPAPTTSERLTSYTGPNVPLLTTGLTTFGLSYAPALVIGAMSSQSADRNLYIPVAGPWLDMANRPACNVRGGPSCGSETTNKVLLGVDGVAQGLGAAMTVVGLLVPTRHTVLTKTTAKHEGPTIRIGPDRLGTGYGVSAVGTW
jgi:hypothetical protein